LEINKNNKQNRDTKSTQSGEGKIEIV